MQSNRQSEEIATLISWSKKLEYDAIVASDRRFITEGSGALLLDGMKIDVLLFLFSDQVLWSRKLGLIGRLKDKYKVVHFPSRFLFWLCIVRVVDPDAGRKDYAAEGYPP